MITFKLDKKSAIPFYRQLIDSILLGVSNGSILPGEKLPTIREMAVRLEVNPNTVVKAYNQLQIMGVLETQQGSGVFVNDIPHKQLPEKQKEELLKSLCQDFIGRAQQLGVDLAELMERLKEFKHNKEE